jgi:hypothetical protein
VILRRDPMNHPIKVSHTGMSYVVCGQVLVLCPDLNDRA